VKTWTCLFLGGPLDGQWVTTEKYRAVQVAQPVPSALHWMAEPLLGVVDDPVTAGHTTYVPRKFCASGWRFPLNLYVHTSLGIVEPEVPIGTVVPGGLVGMGNPAMALCRYCYQGPCVEGYPFCSRWEGEISHAKIVAELSVMEAGL
jgi:hypothetical protein